MDGIPAAIPDPPIPKDYVDQIFKKALAPNFPSSITVEENFIDWGLTKDQEKQLEDLPDKECGDFYNERLLKIMEGMQEEADKKNFDCLTTLYPLKLEITIYFDGKHKGKNMHIFPAFVHGHDVFRCKFHVDGAQ